MPLITDPNVENSCIWVKSTLPFEKCPTADLKVIQYKIWTSVRSLKGSYQARQILALFCNSVPLVLELCYSH